MGVTTSVSGDRTPSRRACSIPSYFSGALPSWWRSHLPDGQD